MTHYTGITINLKGRKGQHQAEHPTMRNWKVANSGKPFASRADAQAWENRQAGKDYPGGPPTQGTWYGYSFDY